jgi:hypothetical protein
MSPLLMPPVIVVTSTNTDALLDFSDLIGVTNGSLIEESSLSVDGTVDPSCLVSDSAAAVEGDALMEGQEFYCTRYCCAIAHN